MTFEELKKELPTIKQKLESGECKVVSIDGPQGPTGKTTAASFLREQGIPVFGRCLTSRLVGIRSLRHQS